MLVMSRSMDYPELLGMLRGKRVAIWTCNTCARLCNNIGGTESCERLAEKLAEDGVTVTKVVSTSAACLEDKVLGKRDEVLFDDPEAVLSMTCSAGADNASRIFGKDIVNPINTFGYGILREDGTPVLMKDGRMTPVGELSERSSPFI